MEQFLESDEAKQKYANPAMNQKIEAFGMQDTKTLQSEAWMKEYTKNAEDWKEYLNNQIEQLEPAVNDELAKCSQERQALKDVFQQHEKDNEIHKKQKAPLSEHELTEIQKFLNNNSKPTLKTHEQFDKNTDGWRECLLKSTVSQQLRLAENETPEDMNPHIGHLEENGELNSKGPLEQLRALNDEVQTRKIRKKEHMNEAMKRAKEYGAQSIRVKATTNIGEKSPVRQAAEKLKKPIAA